MSEPHYPVVLNLLTQGAREEPTAGAVIYLSFLKSLELFERRHLKTRVKRLKERLEDWRSGEYSGGWRGTVGGWGGGVAKRVFFTSDQR